MFAIRWTLLVSLLWSTAAFVSHRQPTAHRRTTVYYSAPDPATAKALTEYMARAHEEKVRAVADVELKYKKEIEDLKKQLAEKNPVQEEPEEDTSIYYPPATNQDLTKKVESYRNFVADYVVKSHIEKYHAVKTAEQKMRDYYEGLIAEMKAGGAE